MGETLIYSPLTFNRAVKYFELKGSDAVRHETQGASISMRLLRAKQSVKKIGNRIVFEKMTSNLVQSFFFQSCEIMESSNPLLTPAPKHGQIHVKTRKKCISARFIAK